MVHRTAHADTAPLESRAPRRGARALLSLVAVVLAVFLLLAGAAQARVPEVFFGIDQGGSVAGPDFQLMHQIKVRTFRLAINWKRVQPQRNTFQWGPVDDAVARLAQNGITPAIFVFGAPTWATGSGNQGVPPLKPGALRKWKTFLKTAVNRYKKGGQFWRGHPSLPVKPVTTWQIWNEPNIPKYFAKPNTFPARSYPRAPKSYAKLVAASDKAIHRADKHAKVVLAGFTGKPRHGTSAARFMKKFLRIKRITKHFDIAALHPYAPSIRLYKKRLAEFRRALKQGGAKKKPVWLTEVGWGSATGGGPLNKGLRGQAKMLQRSFKLTLKKRKKWRIGRLYWFDWRDPAPGVATCTFCPSAGLLKHDGKTKPSYNRFKRFSGQQGVRRHRGR